VTSQKNVEIVRRTFEEFRAGLERGDPGAYFDSEVVADDDEFVFPDAEFEGRSVWRGREGFLEFLRSWTEEFEDWSIRVERWIDEGDDRVVALTRQSALGKHSGVPVELTIGQVYELEEGRVARVRNYLSHADALEAAGLSD
jgi:ketosteroid isomerase-like protein